MIYKSKKEAIAALRNVQRFEPVIASAPNRLALDNAESIDALLSRQITVASASIIKGSNFTWDRVSRTLLLEGNHTVIQYSVWVDAPAILREITIKEGTYSFGTASLMVIPRRNDLDTVIMPGSPDLHFFNSVKDFINFLRAEANVNGAKAASEFFIFAQKTGNGSLKLFDHTKLRNGVRVEGGEEDVGYSALDCCMATRYKNNRDRNIMLQSKASVSWAGNVVTCVEVLLHIPGLALGKSFSLSTGIPLTGTQLVLYTLIKANEPVPYTFQIKSGSEPTTSENDFYLVLARVINGILYWLDGTVHLPGETHRLGRDSTETPEERANIIAPFFRYDSSAEAIAANIGDRLVWVHESPSTFRIASRESLNLSEMIGGVDYPAETLRLFGLEVNSSVYVLESTLTLRDATSHSRTIKFVTDSIKTNRIEPFLSEPVEIHDGVNYCSLRASDMIARSIEIGLGSEFGGASWTLREVSNQLTLRNESNGIGSLEANLLGDIRATSASDYVKIQDHVGDYGTFRSGDAHVRKLTINAFNEVPETSIIFQTSSHTKDITLTVADTSEPAISITSSMPGNKATLDVASMVTENINADEVTLSELQGKSQGMGLPVELSVACVLKLRSGIALDEPCLDDLKIRSHGLSGRGSYSVTVNSNKTLANPELADLTFRSSFHDSGQIKNLRTIQGYAAAENTCKAWGRIKITKNGSSYSAVVESIGTKDLQGGSLLDVFSCTLERVQLTFSTHRLWEVAHSSTMVMVSPIDDIPGLRARIIGEMFQIYYTLSSDGNFSLNFTIFSTTNVNPY